MRKSTQLESEEFNNLSDYFHQIIIFSILNFIHSIIFILNYFLLFIYFHLNYLFFDAIIILLHYLLNFPAGELRSPATQSIGQLRWPIGYFAHELRS